MANIDKEKWRIRRAHITYLLDVVDLLMREPEVRPLMERTAIDALKRTVDYLREDMRIPPRGGDIIG